jgi:hypothetical protein
MRLALTDADVVAARTLELEPDQSRLSAPAVSLGG